MGWKLLSIILLIIYCKKTGVNLAYTVWHKCFLNRLTTGLFSSSPNDYFSKLLGLGSDHNPVLNYFFLKYVKWHRKQVQSLNCYCLPKSQKCGKWQQKYYPLPLFTEQMCKLRTLILNLLWVTDPLQNLMKARKTHIHKIFCPPPLRRLWVL